MGIEHATVNSFVIGALQQREADGFPDSTRNEITAEANALFASDYERLVQHGLVAVHGLNRLRQRFGRPLKAPGIAPDELASSINTLHASDLIRFIHFSPDTRGRDVAPSAYALVHEASVKHEPSSSA